MKKVLVGILLLHFSWHLSAQQETNALTCGTDANWHQILQSQPLLQSAEKQLENLYKKGTDPSLTRGGLVILPVVVHIIHNNGPENITDARVQRMIEWLNDAYRNRNSFSTQEGVDFQIEFCLAQRDPQGMATNGIIRHTSIYTDMSIPSAASQVYSIATWDPQQYINIRLVREVCAGESCIAAGYASMPSAHGAAFDGLVFEAEYAGSTYDDASVIIHEMGHYLGLLHTFQGGCKNSDCLTDGDRVCDTPPDVMTGSFPCDVIYNSCLTDEDDTSVNNPFRSIALGGLGDQPDMIQNYMDYAAYMCYDRFTPGQKDRTLFFLHSARSSLLTSKSCFTPCPNEPIAFFIPSDDTLYAGNTLLVDNASQFASQYTWYINGVPAGHATDTSFELIMPGTYQVTLIAENGLTECRASSYTTTITVLCQVQSLFSYTLDDDTLYVFDQSVFSDSITWIIHDGAGNALFTSHQEHDTFDLSGIAYIQICQYAYDAFCDDRYCIYVTLTDDGIEICNNQIDDDGDQLVDLFDPDCSCSDTTYQAICEQFCQILPDSFPDLAIKLKWESEVYGLDRGILPNLVVGNVDYSDANIEIITRKSKGDWMLDNVENNLLVLDGSSGETKQEFVVNPDKSHYDYAYLTMGDIDRDGSVEYFFKHWDSLFCYSSTGNLRWVSDKLNMGRGIIIGLADFNGDGISEVYSGNNIVNAENGKLLMNSPLSAGCNISNGALFTTCSYNHSIAADLLPSPGLELAAGNMVYEIQINNLNGTSGNTMIPVIADMPALDGITSVGDIDGDGELDVIAVRDISFPDGGGIWVWNPRTRAIIASAPSGASGGFPFIGDVDGDCLPEIGMTFKYQLRMYKLNGTSSLELLYSLPTTDESGVTGITMFDFNQDGKNELIYRDETDLRIITGIDGTTIASYPIRSGTGFESPVVADVDEDGEADIIVTGYLNDPTEQRVFCFESAGTPWAPARSVWNQPGYNVTNVNDDLTIPRYPQNPAKPLSGYENCLLDTCATPYNAFNVQATYRTQAGCVQFPAPDLALEILDYDCHLDSFSICFVVHNIGSKDITDEIIKITCWPSNPLADDDLPLSTTSFLLSLKMQQLDTFCITDQVMMLQDSMYVVVNDPGTAPSPYTFPLTNILECNYKNNMDVYYVGIPPAVLDLGPDIVKCASEVVTLYAGPGFVQYLWSDGTMDSIYSSGFEGIHFVEVTDLCGNVYKDTVIIAIDPVNQIDLGPDITLCTDEEMSFSLPGDYDWIQWLPTGAVNCDSCASIMFSSDTTSTLIAVGGQASCISADSIEIKITQPFLTEDFKSICEGQSLLYRDSLISDGGQFEFRVNECDSLFTLHLTVFQKDTITLDQTICNGDSINFNGNWIEDEGIYSISLSNLQGCDSTTFLHLALINEIVVQESISICEEDSIQIFGQWVHTDGIFSETFESQAGCDSIHQFNISFTPFNYQFDTLNICQGDSVWVGDDWAILPGIYKDTIDGVPCKTVLASTLNVMPPSLAESYMLLCPGDSIWVENAWVTTPTTILDTTQNSVGCDSISLIKIDVITSPDSPSYILNCADGNIDLYVNADPAWRILWSNGDTTNQTTFTNVDTAGLILSAHPACQEEFLIDLPRIPFPSELPELFDTIATPSQPLQLQLPLNANEWSVEWYPTDLFSCSQCMSTSLSLNQNTEVTVVLTHVDGCVYIDSFFVYISEQAPAFYIPNVFSPNGDGQNDTWHIYYEGSQGSIELIEVFDRWGNMIHRGSQSGTLDWDGTYHGQMLSAGVYTYKLLFQPINETLMVIYGDLTLIR